MCIRDSRTIVDNRLKNQIRDIRDVVRDELLSKIGGDVFVGGITAETDSSFFVAIAVAELSETTAPRGIVESGIAPGCVLIRAVVQISPGRAGGNQFVWQWAR